MERAIELIEEKKLTDAPIAQYENKPVTKGKGRFGPYIKWDGMFIAVPKRFNHDALAKSEIDELIAAKIKKEANRYIQRWADEKISIENARWGPVVKFGKKIIRIPRKGDEKKYTADELKEFPLEEVKKWIVEQVPNAFGKKKKEKKPAAPKEKKAPAPKKAAKKAAPKKKK
jgi:DNA topoisomerase-1